MIRALCSLMRQTRIERDDFLLLLLPLVFIIPILVVYALVVIPEEHWPIKLLILVLALLAPAGFVAGYKGWVRMFGRWGPAVRP